MLLLHRSEAEAQIDLALRQAPITITARSAVEWTVDVGAGGWRCFSRSAREGQAIRGADAGAGAGAGAVQRLRDLTVSRAGGSTAAKTVAKGPRAFQEQNCHGWAARNEPPHHAPARRHLERPLTCAQSDEALLIAPKPRTSMPHHHRRCTMLALNVMTTTKVSCSTWPYQRSRQALISIALRLRYLSKPPCCSR